MTTLRQRALAVLREGRCRVLETRHNAATLRATYVIAAVQSSRDNGRRYAIDFDGEQWSCTCNWSSAEVTCSHVAAVKLITGWADAELLGGKQ